MCVCVCGGGGAVPDIREISSRNCYREKYVSNPQHPKRKRKKKKKQDV